MEKSAGNKKFDTLRDRACAKILWGENDDVVYQFLRKEGVPTELADQFIDQAFNERAAMIRKRSLIKFIAGLIGTLVCGGLLAYFEFNPRVEFTGRGYYKLAAGLWTGFAICGLFTLKNGWALLTGKTLGSALDD